VCVRFILPALCRAHSGWGGKDKGRLRTPGNSARRCGRCGRYRCIVSSVSGRPIVPRESSSTGNLTFGVVAGRRRHTRRVEIRRDASVWCHMFRHESHTFARTRQHFAHHRLSCALHHLRRGAPWDQRPPRGAAGRTAAVVLLQPEHAAVQHSTSLASAAQALQLR
jgi:hypothetical protein